MSEPVFSLGEFPSNLKPKHWELEVAYRMCKGWGHGFPLVCHLMLRIYRIQHWLLERVALQ